MFEARVHIAKTHFPLGVGMLAVVVVEVTVVVVEVTVVVVEVTVLVVLDTCGDSAVIAATTKDGTGTLAVAKAF